MEKGFERRQLLSRYEFIHVRKETSDGRLVLEALRMKNSRLGVHCMRGWGDGWGKGHYLHLWHILKHKNYQHNHFHILL